MPSPFPGMNPYFEDPPRWRGFHSAFLVYLKAALTPLLVPNYVIDLEESLYLERPGEEEGPVFAVADASVAPDDSPARSTLAAPVALVEAPVKGIVAIPDQKPVRRLVVRDSQERQVVTVIELLSPSNKRPGHDRNSYLDKRFEIMTSETHLIEIDLLRGGRHMPAQGLPECAYCVMVSRWFERPEVGLWPFGLRDPLPTIPIPLRSGEAEPTVALKGVLDRVYDEGGYAYKLHRVQPDPPLSTADAAWAREIAERAVPRA